VTWKKVGHMFGWFKKKPPPKLSSEMEGLAKRLIGPGALMVAIAEQVGDYTNAVKAGRLSYPAHRRKMGSARSSVVAIWSDLRNEAMHKMFGFGRADLFLLSDWRHQFDLLNTFLDERPHLEFPQPRGQTESDTLQAIWQVYIYLDAVGSEVGDRETDHAQLKANGRDILTDFTTEAATLRDLWGAHRRAMKAGAEPLPGLPRTMIEILVEDVTAKAKSIALSTVFGPFYESNILYMEELVRKDGREGDLERVKASMARVLAAKDPDDVRGE
jgi:hypothetical protein